MGVGEVGVGGWGCGGVDGGRGAYTIDIFHIIKKAVVPALYQPPEY